MKNSVKMSDVTFTILFNIDVLLSYQLMGSYLRGHDDPVIKLRKIHLQGCNY